jgi:hypothetical protein
MYNSDIVLQRKRENPSLAHELESIKFHSENDHPMHIYKDIYSSYGTRFKHISDVADYEIPISRVKEKYRVPFRENFDDYGYPVDIIYRKGFIFGVIYSKLDFYHIKSLFEVSK